MFRGIFRGGHQLFPLGYSTTLSGNTRSLFLLDTSFKGIYWDTMNWNMYPTTLEDGVTLGMSCSGACKKAIPSTPIPEWWRNDEPRVPLCIWWQEIEIPRWRDILSVWCNTQDHTCPCWVPIRPPYKRDTLHKPTGPTGGINANIYVIGVIGRIEDAEYAHTGFRSLFAELLNYIIGVVGIYYGIGAV